MQVTDPEYSHQFSNDVGDNVLQFTHIHCFWLAGKFVEHTDSRLTCGIWIARNPQCHVHEDNSG